MFVYLLRMAVVLAVVFASFNVMLKWRRSSNYDNIYFEEALDSVAGKLGQKVAEYPCVAEQHTLIDQVDAFCQQEGVVKVLQFQSCYVTALCPAAALVALNKDDKMIYKAKLHQ